MGDTGFLENLFHGRLRKDQFFLDYNSVDEGKVQSLVFRLNEVTSNYSPAQLEAEGRVPEQVLAGLKQIGLFGITVPVEYGGLGFSLSEYLRVIESIAGDDMALCLIPLAHLSIGMKGILLFANEQQKAKYLPLAASGEMVFGYALTEPKIGSDAQNISTTALLSEDGTHYILNGGKTYITNGNYAQGLTVFAQTDPENPGKGMGAFIVETHWEGVHIGKDMPKMGLKISSTTAVQFKDVRVPVENRLGEDGDGFKIAMTVLNYGRLGLGAASSGIMLQSLADMYARASSRNQFGSPIKEYELIQEKIVKAKVHAFAARSMTYFTAKALEADPLANVAIESSHCKLYGTTQAWDTLYDALQTAGGSGFLATQPYEKRMRDFRVTTIFEGTSEIHSMYPPLTLLRGYAKEFGGNALAALSFARKLRKARVLDGLVVEHKELHKAKDLACTLEKIIRRQLARGMTRYGKRVAEHEFYLRRVTRLSLAMFQLVAACSFLHAKADRGGLNKEDRALLAYIMAEATEVYTRERHFGPDKLEKAHQQVYASIDR
ncbi:MAG: acyl-CoA dehydrogenase family protein [Spirochaeta sp.]|nr:acyl-CoA dehydrogenase family protein [Spirochaeta sp.]